MIARSPKKTPFLLEEFRVPEASLGLWGDLPYSSIQATVGVPNLIADMNSQQLEFTIHAGGLKQGSGTTPVPSSCDEV